MELVFLGDIKETLLFTTYASCLLEKTFLCSFFLLQELLCHVEEGMGKNLAFRCSDAINASVQSSQEYMIGNHSFR